MTLIVVYFIKEEIVGKCINHYIRLIIPFILSYILFTSINVMINYFLISIEIVVILVTIQAKEWIEYCS